MAWRLKLECFAVGLWLGLSQVALAYHLLFSQGAAVLYYFCLISLWLLGSVLALYFAKSSRNGFLIKLGAVLFYAGSSYIARFEPFSVASFGFLLVATLSFGAYAGWFLKSLVESTGSVAQVMFHENNGFILGYAIAGTSLFFSVYALDLGILLLSLGLILLDVLRQSPKKTLPQS